MFTNVAMAAEWAEQEFTKADLFFGHGTDAAWDDAIVLILHALNIPADTNENVLDLKINAEQSAAIEKLFARRIQERIPTPYLTHEAWFFGRTFYVDERVIIPRSPIAELIEAQFSPWVESEQVHRVLDLCTGSGCIAIACAEVFPDAIVDALDIDTDALAVAKINVDRYGLSERVHLVQSDLFNALSDQAYDIIVSNPPYVDAQDFADLPAEFTHEPDIALASGHDGLEATRVILAQAKKFLKPNGILVVEVGNSAVALEQAFPELPFIWIEFTYGGDGVFLLKAEDLS